ncbi:MAG: diguanylate cyclase, partial [Actinomycetota bacterium]|nr:diguanylate cyclase [Actinomycetota bacterium]
MTPRRVAWVWALTAGTAAAAATLHWMVVPPDRQGVEAWPWVWPLFVLAGFAICELLLVHLRWGRDAVSFSVMEIPLVLGLYFVRPDLLVACRLGGALLAFLWQRKPLQKAAFNCALYALETTAAVVIWNLVVGDRTEYGPWGWLATLLAVAATALIGSTMVSLVITAATGERPRSVSEMFSLGQLGDLANGCVALIAAYILVTDWRASWLLLVFAAVLVVAYRSYDGVRQRSESLEQVNRFTELVGAEVELDSVISTVLREVRAAFDVRTVELRLDGVDGAVKDWALRDGIAVAGSTPLIEALQGGIEPGAALLVPRRGAPTELTALLAGQGARDCLMVPLRSEGRAVGSMLVADMLGDVDTFEPADLSQLRALGNHAAVAIDNAVRAHQIVREAEDRERRAMHDELTGLPNRRLFTRRLDEQLARGAASILLLDLDRFKDVNDTLGHELGDRLLCRVAERLSQAVTGDALVARFGGDEFAVMLPDVGDSELGACAAVVRDALARPFHLAGVAVAVEASVGGAVAADRTDGVTLLRWVDMAMYEAKGRRSGFEVFRPELDRRDSSRLGLLADLREAVAGDLLKVHYQPKVDLRNGRVEGVEALARWHHAEHGPIGPDEFIPLAEHSSLVTPLTMIVLRT